MQCDQKGRSRRRDLSETGAPETRLNGKKSQIWEDMEEKISKDAYRELGDCEYFWNIMNRQGEGSV